MSFPPSGDLPNPEIKTSSPALVGRFFTEPTGKPSGIHTSAQSLSHVQLCDPMNHSMPGLPVHHQVPPPKPMSIESVMPSSHLILCRPLLLPSIFPNIRVFSNESALHIRWPKYWSFSFNISPSNEYSGLKVGCGIDSARAYSVFLYYHFLCSSL